MNRPGSRGFGRPTTSSYGAPGAGFNSSGSEVKVEHRPVTRDGIEGVRLGTAGPSRQVQDVSFYTGMLQRKCEEIVNEMERLNKEAEQMDADQTAHAAYEKRYEELVQSVRELEGTLADHNLALDKARSGSDLSEQQRYCDMVKERNADLAREADEVFRERQRREEAIESLQKQAESMRKQEQQRMESLPQDLRQRVEELSLNNKAWMDQCQQQNDKLERLVKECARADMEVKQNKWREEYRRLEASLERLARERSQLREEAETANMDPAEARRTLLAKAKEHNAQLGEVKKALRQEQDQRASVEEKLRDIETQLQQRRSSSADGSKVEMLVQRDREMTRYIEEEYPERMESAKKSVTEKRDVVVALLEHFSGELQRKDNLPTKERVDDMTDDLSFKKGQMDLSKQTLSRLQAERANTERELAKMSELDERVPRQLHQLKDDCARMESEITAYRDIDALKQQHQEVCQLLQARYREYMARTAGLEGTVQAATAGYKRTQEALAREKATQELEELENKMRRYAQQLFELEEFVNNKLAGTNVEEVRQKCSDAVAEINDRVRELALAS